MVIFHRFLYVYQRVYQIPIRLGDTFLCIKSGFSNLKFHCWHPHVRWDVSSFNHIFSKYFEETSINHRYGYGSIPINTILRGMNIHLPAILMFTRGTRFWHTEIWVESDNPHIFHCDSLKPQWQLWSASGDCEQWMKVPSWNNKLRLGNSAAGGRPWIFSE